MPSLLLLSTDRLGLRLWRSCCRENRSLDSLAVDLLLSLFVICGWLHRQVNGLDDEDCFLYHGVAVSFLPLRELLKLIVANNACRYLWVSIFLELSKQLAH